MLAIEKLYAVTLNGSEIAQNSTETNPTVTSNKSSLFWGPMTGEETPWDF